MNYGQNGAGNGGRSPDEEARRATGKAKAWFQTFSKFVSKHGPKVAEQTWLGGLLAYRRGSKALATNALSASGVDLKSAVVSLALTTLTFLGFNTFLSIWISAAYNSYVPESAKELDSPTALREFIQDKWKAQKENSNELDRIATKENLRLPLHQWISIGFLQITSNKDNPIPSRILKRYTTGDSKGWVLVKRELPSGSGIFEKLLQDSVTLRGLNDGAGGKRDGVGVQRRKLCESMLETLGSSIQLPIRLQMGLNGWIQFTTIFVGLFALTAVLRRYVFVTKLAANWLGANFENAVRRENDSEQDRELRNLVERLRSSRDADPEALTRDEIDRLSRDTTKEIYESYWFIAGIMPSLGFLGTVAGMSSALMLANGLFAAQNKQIAIGEMTTQLGLAFDTTFVALIFGLIVGIPIAYVHARERTFFRELADCVIERTVNSANQELANVGE